MVICKECGFSSTRLQWTHFKYNCTGRFKNGREYLKEYPNERLVDPELAKKTAVTLESLQRKYGIEEGNKRWDIYRKKQAISNTFDYKNKKYGWTKEQFDSYNKGRAVTVDSMVSRYGEELGLQKWYDYCERQKYTKSKEYLIEKYGEDEGLEKFNQINLKKLEPHSPALLAKKLSISIDEAVRIICSRGSYKYTSQLEKDFVIEIEKLIGKLQYSSFRNPFGKWSYELSTYVVYDIMHNNCIIEFNGDYWHANPNQYSPNDLIRGTPAYKIWERDSKKLNLVKQLGFRTYVIWEEEYINNKQETINKVIKWILNE